MEAAHMSRLMSPIHPLAGACHDVCCARSLGPQTMGTTDRADTFGSLRVHLPRQAHCADVHPIWA